MIPGVMEDGTCFCDCGQADPNFFDNAYDGASDLGTDTWNLADETFDNA